MKRFNILLIATLVIVMFSCSKGSDRDEDTSTNSATDYAFGQSAVYDAFKLVHEAANSSKGITLANMTNTASLFGCDTLIVDTLSIPMTITIQFNGSCVGNGVSRTGAITATFSSKYDVFGCVVAISFNNYTYRDYQIGNGTISYSYTGLTSSSPNYSYTVNSVSIADSTKSMSWSGNQTVVITSGETTATVTDDSYSITGSASGRAFAGNEFSATINTDLTLLGNCEWVGTGIAVVSPNNKQPRTLDFGSGCDNKATVKIYSTDQEIEIP